MIIGLFTGMLSPGGVQRAGRHTASVLSRFAAIRNMKYRFLSLNDPRGLHTVRMQDSEFVFSGFAGNKRAFVWAALRFAFRGRLIVSLHPHLAPIAAAIKMGRPSVRSIIFAHGIEVWKPLSWPRGPALRQADLIIVPSADTAAHVSAEQGVPSAKIVRLPWGLDPIFQARLKEVPQPSRPRAYPANARIILAVGRWDPAERYKGADTLISVLPSILTTSPDIFLVLIGDGGDRPMLEQLARDLGVASHVIFLHNVSQEELFACYAHCDIFALPSGGEGFGLVFLEAMANGKPVIGGAHGGTLDVISEGDSGLLVPHGNVGELSRAIASLVADPERARQMGERGRARVEMMYTFEEFDSHLTGILEEVVDSTQPRNDH